MPTCLASFIVLKIKMFEINEISNLTFLMHFCLSSEISLLTISVDFIYVLVCQLSLSIHCKYCQFHLSKYCLFQFSFVFSHTAPFTRVCRLSIYVNQICSLEFAVCL